MCRTGELLSLSLGVSESVLGSASAAVRAAEERVLGRRWSDTTPPNVTPLVTPLADTTQ